MLKMRGFDRDVFVADKVEPCGNICRVKDTTISLFRFDSKSPLRSWSRLRPRRLAQLIYELDICYDARTTKEKILPQNLL